MLYTLIVKIWCYSEMSNKYRLNTRITKTVAAQGNPQGRNDFANFHSAMRWLEQQTTVGRGHINIELSEGVYEIAGPVSEGDKSYYEITANFSLLGSGNPIITLAADDTEDGYALFSLKDNTAFIEYIDIDPSHNGFADGGNLVAFKSINANFSVEECTFKNLSLVVATTTISDSTLHISDATIVDCDQGVELYTIENCDNGIYVGGGHSECNIY